MIKNNRGLTLIESLIWFAIFASVVAGIFAIYKNTNDSNDISRTNNELAQIFVKTNDLYSSGDGFDADEVYVSGKNINDIVLNFGIIPKTLKVNGKIINNNFGGVVNFVNRTTGFVIQYSKVPNGSSCMNIVGGQSKVGWEFVVIDGTRIYYNNSYKITDASTACKQNGSGSLLLQFASCNGGC